MDWDDLIFQLSDWIVWVLQLVCDWIWNWIIEPCMNDVTFFSGLSRGLAVAVVIVLIAWLVLYLGGNIRRYFEPTPVPTQDPGPSPFQAYQRCSCSAVGLFLIFIIIVSVLVALVGQFVGF